MLRLRLPEGLLPCIEIVDELSILPQSHQRRGTEKKFKELPNTAPAGKKEIKQLMQTATLKYIDSSSQLADFHPLLQVPRDHSTLQP